MKWPWQKRTEEKPSAEDELRELQAAVSKTVMSLTRETHEVRQRAQHFEEAFKDAIAARDSWMDKARRLEAEASVPRSPELSLNEYGRLAMRTSNLDKEPSSLAKLRGAIEKLAEAGQDYTTLDAHADNIQILWENAERELNEVARIWRLLYIAHGIAGEAGELIDLIKKHVFHGKPLDLEKAKLEHGDGLWGYAYAAKVLGFTMEESARANDAKLRARYPNGWNAKDAEARKDEARNWSAGPICDVCGYPWDLHSSEEWSDGALKCDGPRIERG